MARSDQHQSGPPANGNALQRTLPDASSSRRSGAPRMSTLAAPTTSLVRQNSNSSIRSEFTREDSAAALRRTLSGATIGGGNGEGGHRHGFPQPSNNHNSPQIKTSTASGILTPANTVHGSPDNSAGETTPTDDTLPDFGTMRHGFEDEYNSEAYLALLEQVFYMYYTDKRHETGGNPKDETETFHIQEWRMRDRLKTVSAALVVCLNVGTDPPDVVKTNPCAKSECWVDITAAPPAKALEQVGKNLQQQYEALSFRTRYKQYVDPSYESTKKFCMSLRRNAKDERILFHYNGHGVPKPTASGEIWVFNQNFTQYIPVPLYDLQSWLGAPSLFVWDCSNAGNIVSNFNRFLEKHEYENAEARAKDPNAMLPTYTDCIQLAACGSKETLPMNPDVPADLFTCCLTTPIEIATRFFVLQNPLGKTPISIEDLENSVAIPGKLQERRTPLGELNWIFTAITDTIAWNSLPRPLFKRLFRQDLMVAALFRNFLLSQRIMRAHGCTPISSPPLPDLQDHPLWKSWDLAVEMVLNQLPDLLAAQRADGPPYEYIHSPFFAEQLTAFEVYLTQGAVDKKPPAQLPIVLQVLLSQVHRLRALILLSKFLDLGPWAVNLALSIGIFPYVLKLLQSAAAELKPVMVFIWARLLAVDQSCQVDLLKDNGYQYFVQIMSPNAGIPVGNASEHRAMCAFILAMFCKDFPQGQHVCMAPGVMVSCLIHMGEPENPLLRQWACLCLSQLWNDLPEAKWQGIREHAHLRLCDMVGDPVPEVRAAVLFALSTFIGIPDISEEVSRIEQGVAASVLTMTGDGSNMVRKELAVFFSVFVKRYESKLVVCAYDQLIKEREYLLSGKKETSFDVNQGLASPRYVNGHARTGSGGASGSGARMSNGTDHRGQNSLSEGTVFAAVWKAVLVLAVDPFPECSQGGSVIVDAVHQALLDSQLGHLARDVMLEISRLNKLRPVSLQQIAKQAAAAAERHLDSPAPPQRQDSYISLSLKRSASIAASLKNLVGLTSTPNSADNSPSQSRAQTPNKSTPNKRFNEMLRDGLMSRPRTPPEWSRPPEESDGKPEAASSALSNLKHPVSRHYRERPKDAPPVLPLKSRFMEWSIEYFREPQMKPTEADEPGSVDYNQRLWRRTRNEKIIFDTQPQKERAGGSKWDAFAGVLNNVVAPHRLLYHQFEDHIVAVDGVDGVTVWDWNRGIRLNRFSNGNPPKTRVSEIKFLNEDDVALLATGSGDGVIRIYRNYESPENIELVTAWRALTHLLPSSRNAGLVSEWQQGRGTMIVGGDVKIIRIWDAPREMCISEIPARSGSCVTSLTAEQVAGNIFVAGFGDGAIRVYDRRLPPRDSMVKVWKDHAKAWIINVHMQRGGERELVSGSVQGDVKLWDIRLASPYKSFQAHNGGMRSLAVHEHGPVLATGSATQDVKVWNTNSDFKSPLSTIRPTSGFLHQHRSAPVSAMTFHPHRMMLAAASEASICVFHCDRQGGI